MGRLDEQREDWKDEGERHESARRLSVTVPPPLPFHCPDTVCRSLSVSPPFRITTRRLPDLSLQFQRHEPDILARLTLPRNCHLPVQDKLSPTTAIRARYKWTIVLGAVSRPVRSPSSPEPRTTPPSDVAPEAVEQGRHLRESDVLAPCSARIFPLFETWRPRFCFCHS